MANSGNLWFDESFVLAIHGFVIPAISLRYLVESWDLEKFSNHGVPVLLFFPLPLGSAMVAMFVTPLWCNEELFVVKSSEVLIMMVSKQE